MFLKAAETGLDKDSVVNASQIRTVDKSRIDQCVGQLDDATMFMVDNALRRVLGISISRLTSRQREPVTGSYRLYKSWWPKRL